MSKDRVAVLDFGSQYTHLIARRVRECGVYSEILPFNIDPEKLRLRGDRAIILSGSPSSVSRGESPRCDEAVFRLGVPVLGICYGAQLMTSMLGGSVSSAAAREYGKTTLNVISSGTLARACKSDFSPASTSSLVSISPSILSLLCACSSLINALALFLTCAGTFFAQFGSECTR